MKPTAITGLGPVFSGKFEREELIGRLENCTKKYERHEMVHNEWLDKLTFKEVARLMREDSVKDDSLYLYIEFPPFELPVLFQEKENPEALANIQFTREINAIADAEATKPNPCEKKHTKLMRSLTGVRGVLDKNLKPNAGERNQLAHIISSPPTKILTEEEKDLVWKFRFFLIRDKKALTKFLKCPDWNDANEAKHATSLLNEWARIDVDDALELLSRAFANQDAVRRYAVSRLMTAEDDELLNYILQLIQALRYEGPFGALAQFLIQRASRNVLIANYLHWYLRVECEDPRLSQATVLLDKLYARYPEVFRRQSDMVSQLSHIVKVIKSKGSDREKKIIKLQEMLDPNGLHGELANMAPMRMPIDPRVVVCGIKASGCTIFKSVMNPLLLEYVTTSDTSGLEPIPSLSSLALASNSYSFINNGNAAVGLNIDNDYMNTSANTSNNQSAVSVTTSAVSSHSHNSGGSNNNNNNNNINGSPTIVAQDLLSTSTDSNGMVIVPSREHQVSTGSLNLNSSVLHESYKIIFKVGDDCRQDQLIIQIISLMDSLLKKENLDLHLTPYQVLTLSGKQGMIEFVQSTNLSRILQDYKGDILSYFRKLHPDKSSTSSMTYGVAPEVLDRFIKSSAGYCVITYILGIGDRHLDNLLLCEDGRVFHIDFAYIFGRDPKPFPPPMKLCKEMVEAMGGVNSEHYFKFRSLCCEAYNILRKKSNLILNLLILMADSSIQEFVHDPDRAVAKVQEKFRLELSDEEAVAHFQALIAESVFSLFPVIMESLHKLATNFRS